MDEKFIKQLISKMKCGVCGRRYESANINVLGQKEDLWFLAVFCPACSTHGLIAATIKEGKTIKVITDLSEEELSKFASSTPVEADEVLDIHNFLKSFDGDFSRLFSKNKRGKL